MTWTREGCSDFIVTRSERLSRENTDAEFTWVFPRQWEELWDFAALAVNADLCGEIARTIFTGQVDSDLRRLRERAEKVELPWEYDRTFTYRAADKRNKARHL